MFFLPTATTFVSRLGGRALSPVCGRSVRRRDAGGAETYFSRLGFSVSVRGRFAEGCGGGRRFRRASGVGDGDDADASRPVVMDDGRDDSAAPMCGGWTYVMDGARLDFRVCRRASVWLVADG